MAQECQVRQNYHEETEAGINKQINLELGAFYTYLSMVCFYTFTKLAWKHNCSEHCTCSYKLFDDCF